MLIGYARVSKSDGSQSTAMQRDALIQAGVEPGRIYEDHASGARADRPGLLACLKAARKGDVLVVWNMDRLARSLRQMVNMLDMLHEVGVELRVLSGEMKLDTTDPASRFILNIFACAAEFERALNSKRTTAGLKAARKRGRIGGRQPIELSKVLAAAEMMRDPDIPVTAVCKMVGIGRSTLYRYVQPDGELTDEGRALLQPRRTRRRRAA